MALERFYRLPVERQQQLLGAAAEAFAEGGYDGTSFNKLIERLGFSKSQAYYYFADKADLFTTACASCYEQFYERVAALPLPGDREAFWQYVLELNRVGFRFYNQHPMAARLARAAAGSAQREQLVQASMRHAGSTHQRYLEWLELGQRLAAVRSDLPQDFLLSLSIQVSAIVDAWFSERAGAAGEDEIEALSRSTTDLSWRMLHPAGATQPRWSSAAPTSTAPRKKKKPLALEKGRSA